MAEPITKPTDVPVAEYLAAVEPERRRLEGERLHEIMRDVTGDPGVMWGTSIVGYGAYRYRYASGREGDWMKVGFSPRKAQLSLYGLKDSEEQLALLAGLGPHTVGVGCVYARRLELLDEGVLRELIRLGMARGDYDALA